MKMIRPALAVCLMVALAAFAVDPSATRLLEIGQWHGNELIVDGRLPWFGLAPTRHGFKWRRYSPRFSMVEDILVDEPGQKTGKAVAVDGPPPLFLLQGAARFAAARVETCFHSAAGLQLAEKPSPSMVLNGRSYSLRLNYVRRVESDPKQESSLLLEEGRLKQVLYTWPNGFNDENCSLIWAGDLDGDGRLDLYMYLSDHYNATEHTLFISSAAGPKQLLRSVAMWRTLGC